MAEVVRTEDQDHSWLQRTWRPITMLTFVALIMARWLAGKLDPTQLEKRSRETLCMVASREGQKGYRRTMLLAYASCCTITGYIAERGLHAAHSIPYRGPVTNHRSNGLLLPASLRSLLNLGQYAIDPESFVVLLSPDLRLTTYGRELVHATLRRPTDLELGSSDIALKENRAWSAL